MSQTLVRNTDSGRCSGLREIREPANNTEVNFRVCGRDTLFPVPRSPPSPETILSKTDVHLFRSSFGL
ncbi:MAG: hypothetical protein SWY16_24410 [Cyanobacteriota bacterium]|nr:hypothetical protein [Cyanobacteriota bacterium]